MTAEAITAARLTGRQARVLDFVRDYYRRDGLPPTTRELREAGIVSSTSVAGWNLDVLARAGLLRAVRRGVSTYYVPVRQPGEPCPTCGCGGHDDS